LLFSINSFGKPTPLMMSPTKELEIQKFPIFFYPSQTTHHILNSSLAQSPDELWSCKVMAKKWLTEVLKVNHLAPKVLR